MYKKKQVVLSVIGVLTLIILVVTASYAYFQSTSSDASIVDANITSHTVDTLTFTGGDKLSLEITQDNFASGQGNLMSETTSSVTLTANSKTNTATEYYNLYFYIGLNEFSYTKDSDTPEVILQVYNNEVEVVDISTLDYKSVIDGSGNTINGYDITTASGIITLYKDKEITASPSKTDNYTFKVIFVNLDYDQSGNAGKRFIGDMVLTQEVLDFTLGDVDTDGVLSNSDVLKLKDIIRGSINSTFNQTFAGDVNLDGILDYIDVTILTQKYNGKINSIPYITDEIYSITYDLGGVNISSLLPNRYASNLSFTISSIYDDNEEYEFLGWTSDDITTPKSSITIKKGTTGDLHFKANWKIIE